MAAKAAQLAQWLKELQDKVNADGNIKYDDILLFTKEKSLTSKQLDSVFKALHEGGVEIMKKTVKMSLEMESRKKNLKMNF